MKNDIPSNTQKRAVIYCRVSTKEQVNEGNSLVSQERLCREYALNEGYEIAEVFIEKGESAKTADRSELQRLLAFCTKNNDAVQAVISYKIDRISRNIADYSYIKVRLKNAGVEIRSVTEYFEDTPAGRFMENIIANVSQFDNEVRTERSVGGMREAVQEGRYVWKAPLGYDNVKFDNKATIAPNSLAPLVKETFELIAQRTYSTEVIRLMMREKGLTDRNGNAVGRSYFFRLLRNPLYKGVIKKFGNTVNGTFEPILTEIIFDEVQAILKGRKNKIKHYLKENPDFPLRRFILNPDGRQLTGYWSQGKRLKYPYYSFHLPGTTIRKEVLEQKFMHLLNRYAFDTKHLNALKDGLEKHFGKQSVNEMQAGVAVQKRIDEVDKQIDKLIDLHSKEQISVNIFTARIKKHETELEELQGVLRVKNTSNINISDLLEYVTEALKNPHLLWQRSPIHIQRKLQVFDFPNGVIFDGINCRTLKICSLFKLKELIDSCKFPRVNSRIPGKNTRLNISLPPSAENLTDTKVYWETIANDLTILKTILSQPDSLA
jgi:site-specific DNA recombinase